MFEGASRLNAERFGEQFLLYLEQIAPKLGVNQQTVYLFLLGEAYRSGIDIVTFSIKTARFQMGKGTGDADKPMAENTVAECVQKLYQVKLLERIDSGRFGTRVRVTLPQDAANFRIAPLEQVKRTIEEIDFFLEPAARAALLEREHHKCFYCARSLTSENYVIEHVVSRPLGNNSFRNLVASCQICNNRKSEQRADDFARTLYREGFLNETELRVVLENLLKLQQGLLLPKMVEPESNKRSQKI